MPLIMALVATLGGPAYVVVIVIVVVAHSTHGGGRGKGTQKGYHDW